MSYAIVRNEKLTRAEINGKSTHNDRKAKNHSNKDIDPSRTHLNYHIKKNEFTYTKEFDKYMKENNLQITEIEKEHPSLLHGKVGAIIAKEKFEFDDEMLEAIENHTKGTSKMSLLSEILFVADSCGADRKYEGTKETYELAKKDLKAAVIRCMDRTIIERIEKQKTIPAL